MPGKKEKQPEKAPAASAYPRAAAPAPYPLPSGAPAYGPPPPYAPPFPGQQYAYAPQSYAPPPPPQTVIHNGGFDGGARFDGISRPSVPPPPPGVMPNASQMAAAHGHNVVVTQGKEGFFMGSSDAGATIF